MTGRTTLTREQLYDLVWTKPVSQLATEYAISNVGLAKLCERHNIPTPPRGYWAKIKAGQRLPRSRLPASDDDSPIHLRLAEDDPEAASSRAEVSAKVTKEKRAENCITVADRLQSPSAVVRHASAALHNAEPNDSGMLPRPPHCLDLRVSRAQLSRALRIADALVKHFEAREWEVTVTDDSTLVKVDGVPVTITIEETSEPVELPVKPSLTGSYSFHYGQRQTTSKPSGRLSIGIRECSHLWHYSQQRNWRETENRLLEENLNKVVVGMLKLAAAVRVDEERQERRNREEQERQKKLQAALDEQSRLRAVLAKEKKDVQRLLEQAARWRESQNLRLFVQHARERGSLHEIQMDEQLFAEWAAWALKHAERLDPFVASPHCILDDADRIDHMCDGLRSAR